MREKHRMRIIIGTILIGILGVLITSCNSKKTTNLSKSEFLTDSIYSKYLNEYRKHNVYLPKDFDNENEYPIIYATDGNSSLVDRFQNHKLYFTKELITEIEKNYNQEIGKTDRYFYGVSNGAGFGLSLLNNNPDVIGTYICFSTFGGDIQSNTWNENVKYPNLYLRYGSDEFFGLKEDSEFLESKYTESNSFIETKEYEGGHNNEFWKKEFSEIIPRILKVE